MPIATFGAIRALNGKDETYLQQALKYEWTFLFKANVSLTFFGQWKHYTENIGATMANMVDGGARLWCSAAVLLSCEKYVYRHGN